VLTERLLLRWTHAVTGLEPERVDAARAEIATWRTDHPARTLLTNTIDAAVAATLLTEGVDKLVSHGVPRERLHRKLRLDRELWGTWAEIRAADLLLRTMPADAELRLEEGRSEGAHADFRLLSASLGLADTIEVKAIGLSDDEVAFCERMGPALPTLLPGGDGLAHFHAWLDTRVQPRLTSEQRRAITKQAAYAATLLPDYPAGLRGATVVGHGSESDYARRVGGRVVQAVRQFRSPSDDECWVAIYWSNGAPIDVVHAALRWSEIPRHVVGIILVGCGVIFGEPQIHCFTTRLHRHARPEDSLQIRSLSPLSGASDVAGLIFETLEKSSSVRPTLLKAGRNTVLERAGERRIMPFNLLLGIDPDNVGRNLPTPPFAQ